jgi:hypothetical protein
MKKQNMEGYKSLLTLILSSQRRGKSPSPLWGEGWDEGIIETSF